MRNSFGRCPDCDVGHRDPHSYWCLNKQLKSAESRIKDQSRIIDEKIKENKNLQERLEREERWKIQQGRELPQEILFPLWRSEVEMFTSIPNASDIIRDTHATARYLLEDTNLSADGRRVGRVPTPS